MGDTDALRPRESHGRTGHDATLTFTARIAGWSARHRWLVLTGSAVAIFLAVVAMIAIGTDLRDDDEGVGGVGQGGKADGRAVPLSDRPR